MEALHLPASPSSPRRARQFVDEVLHRWHRDGAIDRLALIASELVTNAVRHAQTEITIELSAEDGALHLEVFDRGAGQPVFKDDDPEVPGGLGLPIVEALATSWGMRLREGGKGVWAEVRG
ncbi:MAG TPA: ATP-binding protein [Acidimicrobiales bacterium]|nr:ATP-binding protein [Acidimicrobiales bacterium]